MNRLKFLLITFSAIALMVGIYSCAKDTADTSKSLSNANDPIVESRMSGSACNPQTLFTEYSSCTHITKTNVPISFALGNLYNTSSKLYQLCPNIVINVTYTYSKCIIGATGSEVHFIRDLSYNLTSIIAACPALQAEINYQQSIGNLVSFLDFLDDDISRQVEFTEVYNAAISSPNKYKCPPFGDNFYSVKYIKNTCYKWTVLLDPSTTDPKHVIAKKDCGSTVCCARSNKYCVLGFEDGKPNILIGQSQDYQKFEGTCTQECTHDCGALDPNSF